MATKETKTDNFEHSGNLVNTVNFLNSSTAPSDYQLNLSEIPTPYQLYWETYQAQEQFFAKGKITEAEFLAVKSSFDDVDLSSASIFGNGLGGLQ